MAIRAGRVGVLPSEVTPEGKLKGGSQALPIASANTLGGIKVGSGLSIDSDTGVLSASGGSGGGDMLVINSAIGSPLEQITTPISDIVAAIASNKNMCLVHNSDGTNRLVYALTQVNIVTDGAYMLTFSRVIGDAYSMFLEVYRMELNANAGTVYFYFDTFRLAPYTSNSSANVTAELKTEPLVETPVVKKTTTRKTKSTTK